MPRPNIKFLIFVTCLFFFGYLASPIPSQERHSPITTYYLSYNENFINNRIVNANLVMVPAAEEFQKEKFSCFFVQSVINVTPMESKSQTFNLARDKALKQLLITHGLKSVSTRNNETQVSHEGMVQTPIRIHTLLKSTQTEFHFRADVNFCPLPFPADEWHFPLQSLLKNTLEEFLELF